MTRIRLQLGKPKPKNWVRHPCVWLGCGKAAASGHLCVDHQAEAVEATRDESGLDLSRLAIHDGYVRAKVGRTERGVHQIVMESLLGRPLLPGENVHHKNGCRWDNRPTNLELWVTAQPAGQRPSDLAQYARRLLAIYGTTDEQVRYRVGA